MMTKTQVRAAQIVKKDNDSVAMVFFADPQRSKQISKWLFPSVNTPLTRFCFLSNSVS